MSKRNENILSTPVEYVKGIGPQRAELLKKELGIFTFKNLLEHFPYRHIDKTIITPIKDISFETEYAQIAARIINVELTGNKSFKRLVATVADATGTLDLVWFQGINWIHKTLIPGNAYLIYGRVSYFNGQLQISHPELEPLTVDQRQQEFFRACISKHGKTKSKRIRRPSDRQTNTCSFLMLEEKDIPEKKSSNQYY